jgi:Positive regulator of sigma E activity
VIRELAEVVSVENDFLLVSTELKTGCSGCAQQNTCGAGVISKAFSDRRAEFRVHKPQGYFRPGQQIELLLPEQALTRYSLLVYMVPLFALLVMAIFTGQLLSWSEGWVILSAFSGFAVSFYLLRRWLQHRDIQVAQLLSVQQID